MTAESLCDKIQLWTFYLLPRYYKPLSFPGRNKVQVFSRKVSVGQLSFIPADFCMSALQRFN